MIALIDLDSILYKAVYRIVSVNQMREALTKHGKEGARQWLMEEVYNEGINRCENELLKMQNHLQSIFFEEIQSFELFITTCENSFRKEICPTYKANRKRNKYVWLLREHYRFNNTGNSSTLEADDLIQIRAKEIGVGKYIIVSIDKDLKQIGGYFWSYYKQKDKDHQGNYILNEFGYHESSYKQNAVEFISRKEADKMFWTQMLMGDATDNIKALNRVGLKIAEKIINKATIFWFAVAREYIRRNQKEDFYTTYQLLKLGSRE